MQEGSAWPTLDVELFFHVISLQLISPRDLCNILATCKAWRDNFGNNDVQFWQPLNRKYFGGKKKDPQISWKTYYLVLAHHLIIRNSSLI